VLLRGAGVLPGEHVQVRALLRRSAHVVLLHHAQVVVAPQLLPHFVARRLHARVYSA